MYYKKSKGLKEDDNPSSSNYDFIRLNNIQSEKTEGSVELLQVIIDHLGLPEDKSNLK